MYEITEKEFNFLQRVISNQIASYNANVPHYSDELWSIGIYTIGKACAKYDESNTKVKFTTYATTAIINNFRCWFRDEKKRMTDAYIDADINENEEKNLGTFHQILSAKDEQSNLELHLDLQQAMKVLSKDELTTVEMYMQSYTLEEISHVIGYTHANSVARILKRAYDKVKKELQYV